MTYQELTKVSNVYEPAILLDSIMSAHIRAELRNVLLGVFALLGFLAFCSQTFQPSLVLHIKGVLMLVGLALLVLHMFEFFYHSFYFKDIRKILSERAETAPGVTFAVASLLYSVRPDDITASLLSTPVGTLLLNRLSITEVDQKAFLANRVSRMSADKFVIGGETRIDLPELFLGLYKSDQAFADFLFSHRIQERDLEATADWTSRQELLAKRLRRWWSRDTLGRIPGIGKEWGYGRAFTLQKYTKHLSFGHILLVRDAKKFYGREELEETEAILSRNREANVLLVGDDEAGKMDIISRLAAMVEEGRVLPPLEGKNLCILDQEAFAGVNNTKALFELEFTKVLREASAAGNVILVLEDLAGFITSVRTIGVDLVGLMEADLGGMFLQIIALSDLGHFHAQLEQDNRLMQHFETILMNTIDTGATVKLIEDEVASIESKQPLFFTYPALLAIVESADRYFPNGVMPDKAFDLLLELVPKLVQKKKRLVEKADVMEIVQTKTGIPLGEVKSVEKEKFANLEALLHKTIVGQEEAITAISNALRRARSGIANPNRPMGSFLFLGPTGVGKTETTKALAQVFFGNEKNILRLDMSEYTAADSLGKLIGSFESDRPGVLASMLREHPYGVLLLDEFEKTTKDVMNLFLQVLDEGFFSDMKGKKINARNLIIIATSNAGSDMIWQAIQAKKNLAQEKAGIIDELVKNGTFKPELLNRFDGVVLFHPLQDEHLEKVARLMLEKLRERLKDKGVDVVVNDVLIKFLMKEGNDPKFGARPMNRAIQDKIEQKIAAKLISGEIRQGNTITLSEADLA